MLDHAFTFVDTVIFWIGDENWRSQGGIGRVAGRWWCKGQASREQGGVMSDLPIDAGAKRTSPLISFWLSPRQTIELLVAERPRHLVLPLITLGGAASAANLLAGYGAGSDIVGWRTLLACAVGAGLFAFSIFTSLPSYRLGRPKDGRCGIE
jgi:hypothetical protein